jgi:hypothetical protein
MSGFDITRMADSYQPDFGLLWQPVLSQESLLKLSDRQLFEYSQARKAAQDFAEKNPVGSGWIFPSWKRVLDMWKESRIIVILGGNRSAKSTLASRLCIWAMGTIPECEIRAFHVNGERSKQDQQRAIYDALPHSLRHLPTKRGANHTVQYTQANGFTGDKMILPPLPGCVKGGQITFSNYASYSNDSQVAEGFKSHLIWLDEAAPEALFKTLQQRTTDYRGRIILTFTVLNGWTGLVQQILGKAKTLEWRHASLVNKRLPVLQQNMTHEGMFIHYFWTEDNPFIPVEEFRSKMRGLPEEDVLARAYGVPTKAVKAVFTKFDRSVHVVKHEDLPFVKNPQYPVTRYMIMDPGGSKNDFIGWVAIDAAGTRWCYREWPDFATYREWALPSSTPEGKEGPAQRSLGWGIEDTVNMIREKEGDEVVFERLIDPRMGAAERKGELGATTLITDYDKGGMTFIPAPGVDIKSGIKLIQGLLNWNPDKPRDSKNSPKIYFSDRCENWIMMMSEWTNYSPTEHTKEGPDLLRYLETSSPQHFQLEDLQPQGQTFSY